MLSVTSDFVRNGADLSAYANWAKPKPRKHTRSAQRKSENCPFSEFWVLTATCSTWNNKTPYSHTVELKMLDELKAWKEQAEDDETVVSHGPRRTAKIITRVTPDMHKRVLALAEEYGQTPATIASLALSEWVRTREMQHIPIKGMIEAFETRLDQFSDEPAVKNALQDLLTQTLVGSEKGAF